jgi:hypothetical protein
MSGYAVFVGCVLLVGFGAGLVGVDLLTIVALGLIAVFLYLVFNAGEIYLAWLLWRDRRRESR